MSNVPPQQGGWIDGSGNLQQGSPPPGFWQASDGRWYSPDLASSSTQSVGAPAPSPYGPPPSSGGYQGGGPPGPPPYGGGPPGLGGYPGQPGQAGPPGGYQSPTVSSGGGSKTGLYVALGVVAAVVLLGVVAAVLVSAADDDDPIERPEVATETTVGGGGSETTAGSDATAGAGGGGGDTGGEGGEGGSAASCARLDAETLEIDYTNDSSETSNYSFTIVHYDEAGSRVDDGYGYFTALRPGERTVERVPVYDTPGATCEVVSIDRQPIDPEGEAAAADATCTINGEDTTFNTFDADVEVTNNLDKTYDFSLDVAFIDPDGVRRATDFALVEAVRAGETAPKEVLTFVEYNPDYTCEVIYADVYE